jgi:hypothetical protein
MKNIKEYYTIAVIAFLDLFVHLIADYNSGYSSDEFLYINAGKHLAFGYMEFSPVIACLAYFQNLFQSDSLFINHLFCHVATCLIYLYCGLITLKLGGRWIAVLIVMMSLFFSPGFAVTHALFVPVTFEQLTWVLCIYLLVSYCTNPSNKYLVLFGVSAVFGFYTKYSVAFLLTGVLISVFVVQRNIFKNKAFWIALLIFIILIIPNILWQINNNYPVFRHFSELYNQMLNKSTRFNELKTLFLSLNPTTFIFWISGLLIVPFMPIYKKYRALSYALLIAFMLLLIAKGKSYYYFPVILGVLACGSVFVEQLLYKQKWLIISYLVLVSLLGTIILPMGLSVLPLNKFICIYKLKKNDDHKFPVPLDYYYSKYIWNKMLATVSLTFKSLQKSEQDKCLIWGRHYSQAGGINLFGKRYGLPKAFSFHASFYNWVPYFTKDYTIIVITDPAWDRNRWLRYFDSVEEVGKIENPYTIDKDWYFQSIFLCKNLKYDSKELKELFKNDIY